MKDFFPRKFGPKTWVHIIHGSALYLAKCGVCFLFVTPGPAAVVLYSVLS